MDKNCFSITSKYIKKGLHENKYRWTDLFSITQLFIHQKWALLHVRSLEHMKNTHFTMCYITVYTPDIEFQFTLVQLA